MVARTKVYHCNFIPEVGLVYLPILWDKWSPAQGIIKVLLGIVEILKNPDVGTQQHFVLPEKVACALRPGGLHRGCLRCAHGTTCQQASHVHCLQRRGDSCLSKPRRNSEAPCVCGVLSAQ